MKRRWTSLVAYCISFLYMILSPSIIISQPVTSDSLPIYGLIERAKQDITRGQLETLALRIDSLETIIETVAPIDWQLVILTAITELNILNRKLTAAETCTQRALGIIGTDRQNIPDTLVDLVYYLRASIHSEQGQWDLFERYIDSSYQILNNLPEPDPIREARNAIRMSFLTYNQGNLSKTIEWTKIGIEKMRTVEILSPSDSTQIASLYNNIAFLNDAGGRFDEVIPNYNYALLYDPTLISAYINQAVKLRSTLPERSIELSQQALKIIPKNSYHNRCNAYSNIVSASLVMAQSFEDSTHFNKALLYHDSILSMTPYANEQDYPFAANSHGLFADYYSRVAKKRDLDKAWHHLQQNIDLVKNFSSITNTQGLARIMYSHKERLSRLSIMKGDFVAADKSLKEVNKGYRGADYKEEDEFLINSEFLLNNTSALAYPLTYLSLLIEWSTKMDNPTIKLLEAEQIYQIIDSTYDKLLHENELDIEDINIDRLHSRGAAIAIQMHETSGDDYYLEEAYNRIEKLFSLDLFSNLIRTKLKNSTDTESAIYRQKLILREEIDLLERQNSTDAKSKIKLDSLNKAYVEVVDILGTDYKSITTNEAYSIPLEQLRNQINSNEAMLYYVHDKMGSSLYGLCIAQDTIVPIQKKVTDLEYLIYETNTSLANPQSLTYKSQLQELYNIFIGGLEDIIEDKDLSICSMGKLELAPYDLLMNEAGNYLCFRHSIRHIYSAGWNENKKKSNSNGIYAYTSSPKNHIPPIIREGEAFTNLKGAREEIDFLKNELNAKAFIDEKSTKAVFQKTSHKASIIHLALHGVANPSEPLKSRLIFDIKGNEEEDLFYHEIDDLEIGAELVTLSACNSGGGVVRGAGSIASLARAFHYAGCPNVLQTLWSINDASSLILMKAFYQKLKEGEPIPAALRSAKQEFYSNAPSKWKHPYYWGGYIYNGQNRSITLKQQCQSWLYIACISTLFLALIFLLVRKFNIT